MEKERKQMVFYTHKYSYQSKKEILITLGVSISIICQAITRSVPLAVLNRLP